MKSECNNMYGKRIKIIYIGIQGLQTLFSRATHVVCTHITIQIVRF